LHDPNAGSGIAGKPAVKHVLPATDPSEQCRPARADAGLRAVLYRSEATRPMAPPALAALVAEAEVRNRAAGIGGVLFHDRGVFLQALEGPAPAVERLLEALRRDPRHGPLDVLADRRPARRAFPGWNMPLAASENVRRAALHLPPRLIAALHGAPERLPALMAAATRACAGQGARAWCPEADGALAAGALVRLLLGSAGAAEPGRADALVAAVAPGRRDLAGLLEAAAEAAGDLWIADRCDGRALALALSGLMGIWRHRARENDLAPRPGLRALVAMLPGEAHLIGAVIKAELLRAAGWEVAKAFPADTAALAAAVRAHQPELLVIATSRALPRLDGAALSEAIDAARAARPSLRVIAGGRSLRGCPERALRLGADASCLNITEIAAIAEALSGPSGTPAASRD